MKKKYSTGSRSRMWRKVWYTPPVQKNYRYYAEHCRRKKMAEEAGTPAPKFHGPTKDSLIQYVNITYRFALYCRQVHGVSQLKDMVPYFSEYIAGLIEEAYSPYTIQTYVAAIRFVLGCERPALALPPRRAAMARKGRRDLHTQQGKKDLEASAGEIFEILRAVGIRRREFSDLTGDCLVEDESGELSVLVKKGKGGKRQLQRILPGDEELLRLLFDGDSRQKVFPAGVIDRIPNLHIFRRICALRAYRYYESRLHTDPEYRWQLMGEIAARWHACNPGRRIPMQNLQGEYVVAGMNRRAAECFHIPTRFDRLAVMAVTVFHLSHWRLNVAINHYLLPALQEEAGITDAAQMLAEMEPPEDQSAAGERKQSVDMTKRAEETL